MAIDNETLAAAMAYTKATAIGGGAIKGDKGDKGEKGDPGENGHDGLQGPKGDTGNTGATGPKGADGVTPSISIGSVASGESPTVTRTGTDANPVFNFTFPKGDKGDKGEKGEAGRDGQDGKSFEIKARFATEEELIEAFPHGPENTGDAYFVGTTSNPDLYIWITADEEWVNNGPIAGVKGDKGDTGDTGADGFSPVASVTKSGKVATITIRDKVGTTSETVSDGADGNDGADGDSAYDVAVEEGFVGTKAEWLASLKGETGDGIYAVTVSQVEGASHLMIKFTSDTSTWVDCGIIASDIPIATVGQLGKVKPDGTSITIDEYGTISGASTLTAGAGIDITNNVVSSKVPIFVGTQAEWDALSTAIKKTYGQVNITDDESGTPEYYSTTETKTNKVWIDGKPIYRKVFYINNPVINWTKVSLNLNDIDWIVTREYTAKRTNNAVITEYYNHDSDNYEVHLLTENGTVFYYCQSSTALSVMSITIEYTKTTD